MHDQPVQASPKGSDDARQDESVLNSQAELGVVGKARSSGGAGAARFIRNGMPVLTTDGTQVGIVERVEGAMIVIAPEDGETGSPFKIPLDLVDGVDDVRVILAPQGDGSYGVGAAA